MDFLDSFFINVKKINLVHEFILNNRIKCAYLKKRERFGLVYAIDGEAKFSFFSGESVTLLPGEMLLLTTEASYSVSTEKNNEFKHFTVNFDIDKDNSNADFLCDTFCVLKPRNTALYYHLFKQLITVWTNKKIGYEMYSVAFLYQLLGNFCAEIYEKNHLAASYHSLQQAKKYIDEHFNCDLNLNFLANISNMSTTNFRREWKRLYGMSPMQYRDKIRLYYAKEYLLTGYYSVSEVSNKCGFSNSNYFIRFFRKHEGISPGKFYL